MGSSVKMRLRCCGATVALAMLAGCGAYSDSEKGPAPTPTPTPTATPTPGASPTPVTAAASCPTIADPQGLLNAGTITGPTGTYRICALPSQINVSIRLPRIAGLLYELPGRVDVGLDGGATASARDTKVTLSIDPGVVVFGLGASWLAVNRGNKLDAVGTATSPIVFTSRDNVQGINTADSSGQWGGVVLMGRAPITDCALSAAPSGTAACEAQTEGELAPALYGGATPADSSGRMSFVQIRYSGFALSANQELQALTAEGIGSGTTLDHIMSYNSSDDGAEFFGGRVSMKNFIAVGAEDDSIDTDAGVKANFQYVMAIQRQGFGDAIIEADTDNSTDGDLPRQNTLLSNFTFIDRSPNFANDQASILLRGGTDYTLANGILVSAANPCLRISGTQTASATINPAIDELGAPLFRAVEMQCGMPRYIGSGGVTDSIVALLFGTGANDNNDAFTPSFTSLFVNGPNEARIVGFDAKTLGAFFDTTSYIGAVRDATDRWYAGWTCNSTAADFGTGNSGACSSIPVI